MHDNWYLIWSSHIPLTDFFFLMWCLLDLRSSVKYMLKTFGPFLFLIVPYIFQEMFVILEDRLVYW